MPKIESDKKNLKIQDDVIKQIIRNDKSKDIYIEESKKVNNKLASELKWMTIIAGILFYALILCLLKLSN